MAINVVTFSSAGGAGKVSKTLVDGFSKIGLEANLLTASKSDLRSAPLDRPSLTLSASADEYILKSKDFEALVSISRDKHSALGGKLPAGELNIFRWMNGLLGDGFLAQNPQFGNLVWGLDDMNPFTGGCHYSGNCNGFESNCGSCPAARLPFRGLVEKNLDRKLNFARQHQPKYVAPTDWMKTEFQKSSIGSVMSCKKILNPLQSRFFEQSGSIDSTSGNLRVLIVAANLDDPTKGIWDIKDTLNRVLAKGKTELTLIGRYSSRLAKSIPGGSFVGSVDSQSVMQKLREHDLLLVPSLFENAGTVVAEAASQGVPALARGVGGMPEMTNYGNTGYLFQDNTQLEEIMNSMSKRELHLKGVLAQEWAQKLKPEIIATEYAEAFL